MEFQFPLLGSHSGLLHMQSEHSGVSIPFVGFGYAWGNLCLHSTPTVSIPFVGFRRIITSNALSTCSCFNSLCWVLSIISMEFDGKFLSFNSLCWVPKTEPDVNKLKERMFQFPLLGSSVNAIPLNQHSSSFNSLCWVPILLFLFFGLKRFFPWWIVIRSWHK